MKFTLKNYQEDAVAEVLDRLRKSRKRWHEDKEKNAFSLTATTGAGKTVMAASVLEALFYGSDEPDFDADPGAVVIWFSDDPSLNEQSRYRLLEASDKLTRSQLETVESSFNREILEPGKIYFLNTQKLSKTSLLTRGHDGKGQGVLEIDGMPIAPDGRSHTIWQTIQNTIEDPDLTLYLVLDEAHRGIRDRVQGTQTIVTRLINGHGNVPGIPIVWGISATVDRFNEAIENMQFRTALYNVVVDSKRVQDSGLLKDTINLDVPDEAGDFATVLLRRGTDKLRDISHAWEAYAKEQGDTNVVKPLMVLQVPNSPDPQEIGIWLETIFNAWPELPHDSVYNVFGEHKMEIFGRYQAPYVEPERVQEATYVRILVAKDAISTGWDCPRAEVMVSFRAATDRTHITQLLGRMVRTPLARRIPGNDRLNAVDCLLPHFNKTSVEAVVTALMTGEDTGSELPGRRVLIDPVEVKPNPVIAEEVWDKLLSLPSQMLPRKESKPVKRLTALAHELAFDAILPDAGKIAHARMHRVLEGAQVTYADEIKSARGAVLAVEGKTLIADVETKQFTFDDFVEKADYAVIEDAYKRAGRSLSPDLARSYAEYLADKAGDDEDEIDALIDAHTTIAAIGLVSQVTDYLEREAEKLAKEWFDTYRVNIRSLNDKRQDVYRQIQAMSSEPQDVSLAKPVRWLQPTTIRDPNGQEISVARYEHHLLCDTDALFPEHFKSSWETDVLQTELARGDTIAWYRNPSRAAQESLGIAYENGGEPKIVRPDFVIFSKAPDGSLAADIVDPHGNYFDDALPRLKGLAVYAEAHGSHYRRIEVIAKIDGAYRVIDLKEAGVRDAVNRADSVTTLFKSKMANDYQ